MADRICQFGAVQSVEVKLIDAVLADETLEALEVVEADSLMVDGDQVNP